MMEETLLELGNGSGSVVDRLLQNDGDIGHLRPYSYYKGGPTYVTLNAHDPAKAKEYRISNATASLLYEEWKTLDTVIIKAARNRLQFWNDLRSNGTYRVPNGLGTTVIQWQRTTAMQPATQSMDGMTRGNEDRIESESVYLPVPMLHKDFSFSMREIETARDGRMPLDTSNAEEAGRRVAELMEAISWGTQTGIAYGPSGSQVYGAMTFPDRNTKTLTAPTGSNGGTTITEVLDMRQKLYDDGFYGPYKLYFSTNWAQFLDADFSTAKGDNTLRQRLKAIRGISDVVDADYLVDSNKYVGILMQETASVADAVIAQNMKVVMWDSHGGFRKQFKVFMAGAPRFRSDVDGKCGMCHGSN